MSRRPALVTQADVARALRAVEQCRYPGVVEIGRDGTIRILPLSSLKHEKANNDPKLDDDTPIEL